MFEDTNQRANCSSKSRPKRIADTFLTNTVPRDYSNRKQHPSYLRSFLYLFIPILLLIALTFVFCCVLSTVARDSESNTLGPSRRFNFPSFISSFLQFLFDSTNTYLYCTTYSIHTCIVINILARALLTIQLYFLRRNRETPTSANDADICCRGRRTLCCIIFVEMYLNERLCGCIRKSNRNRGTSNEKNERLYE